MICPRDCFFCLKRILIFIYNIYNTYYKNIYIIYSIYTSGILEFWIGFLPSGLTRWLSGCRDGIRYEARRHTPSSVVNRTRAKLILCYRVRLDSLRVGRWIDDKKGNGRIRQHGDVCEMAEGRYVCRSNKSILHCANDQWGLTKPTQEQIREMYLSTR